MRSRVLYETARANDPPRGNPNRIVTTNGLWEPIGAITGNGHGGPRAQDRCRRRTMPPMLSTLPRTRRRFLGSAAATMLAARLSMTGSARAQAAKETMMTTATAPRYAAQD